MRTLIARAAALAAAAAAIAVPAAAATASGGPVLAWSPATYNSGSLAAGQTAATTFTLANTGGSASSALTITLPGSAAFAKTADTCTGTSLGPGKTCTVTVTYTAPAVPGQTGTATLTAASNKPAATATATLAGAAAKAAPALTATASGGGPVGTTVTDTATLSGGYQPGGTIEFQLYPAADCSGTPVDDETVTVTGDGTYTTPAGATPAQPGTYSWTARYSGDAANTPAVTACGAGTVTITKASPAIVVQNIAGDCHNSCPPGTPTGISVTLSGGSNPTGTIEFKLYGPNTAVCSGSVVADETVTVTGNGTYTTPQGVVPPASGFYGWAASYSGDAGNTSATVCVTLDNTQIT